MTVGLVFSDRYLQHDVGPYRLPGSGRPLPFVELVDHPSNWRLVARTKKLLDLTGLSRSLVPIPPYLAGESDLGRVHAADYIARVEAIAGSGGGDAGQGAPVGPDSYEIARLAAGGAMAAVDAVMTGTVRHCYALIRPPGHHAVRDIGMGYCIFNNVAVAARHAQQAYGVERVLIVDWDVHHGNGTQDAFWDDPSVLFISLHQEGLYPPDSGQIQDVGAGAGEGFTVNIPLPAGSGDAAYRSAFQRLILPIARRYRPELVLVSVGQDASTADPLGRMCLTTEAYRWMMHQILTLAEEVADGRLVVVQEGGYSEIYGPYCTLAVFEGLTGQRTGIEEPLDPARLARRPTSQVVSGDQAEAIAQVVAVQNQYWGPLE
ncbi:class II histone deacetylase [Thermomicrobiaceae bacterium CFH 74404]|uniref:Class II histone deacetylase n=1 Tax=Thermalbibacter longus TaxID=2951981 RepID=A0AA41WBV2_9BACT|nr:class II histone deacetylase [Thermalbibacter longus]MCM8750086.1 class II histone deacetylase [Thermalbibacter longus]